MIATAGALGGSLAETGRPVIAIAMASPDREAFIAAHEAVVPRLGSILPTIVPLDRPVRDPQAELARPGTRWTAIVSGTVQAPVLTGPAEAIEDWKGPVAIIAAQAVHGGEPLFPAVALTAVSTSTAREANGRIRTAQAAQTLMFMLTMLLAGMVLSNLVEEKSNKIIEILAAAIPIDAVFLGKLFAMLAVSLVAIAIWAPPGWVWPHWRARLCSFCRGRRWAGRCSLRWEPPISPWPTCCSARFSLPWALSPTRCAMCRRFPCPSP